ncbi:hypothetical protein T492DRAFT_1035554 [Pavlovales sp. CCMP2436]|nr:hypothetical protein T492DRAFT_1035554 [Pavlovales sp. CCMP2436]
MRHWNPEHIPVNSHFTSFRPMAPASQPVACVPSMTPEKVHNIVYYTRDKARSRTSAYPATLGGLSGRHPLTKLYPLNVSPEAPAHLNKQGHGIRDVGALRNMLNIIAK